MTAAAPQRRLESFSVATVHAYALFATDDGLQGALREAERTGAPAAAVLALDALKHTFAGDPASAIALFRRAIASVNGNRADAHRLADLLFQLYLSGHDFDAATELLNKVVEPAEDLAPIFLVTRGLIAAATGKGAEGKRLAAQARSDAARLSDDLTRARVLNRSSVTAYYLDDFNDAWDFSIEAVELAEAAGAHLVAATSYTMIAALAEAWKCDPQAAALHAAATVRLAEKIGHDPLRRAGLIQQFWVAAERYDRATFDEARAKLLARPRRDQYRETFGLTVAEALGFGWRNEFTAAAVALADLPERLVASNADYALRQAMLGLISAANGDVERARVLAREALERSVKPAGVEPLHQRHHRECGRLVAAATCFLIGDTVRGRRALSSRFDPEQQLLSAIGPAGVDADAVPPLFRGFAEFINAAYRSAAAHRPRSGLTPAEMAVLSMLPSGITLAAIAAELGKAPKTVQRQVESIYAKLGANNRAHAIERAREVGLLQ